MNKEEKEAIAILKYYRQKYSRIYNKEEKALDKVLELVDKQQNIIEEYKKLKDKIHKILDVNGITRAFQLTIDDLFEEIENEIQTD